MKSSGALFTAVAVAMATWVPSAQAHHSSAMFSLAAQDIREITGTVTKFAWGNPHTWIWMAVPGTNGKPPELWGFEMASPGSLRASGLNWDSVKVGETLTIFYGPARDGSNVGVVAGKLVHGDGRVWVGRGTASPVQGRYNSDGSLASPPSKDAAPPSSGK